MKGNLVEDKVSNRIDLENRMVGVTIPWDQCSWSSVAGGALAESFSCALYSQSLQVGSTPDSAQLPCGAK